MALLVVPYNSAMRLGQGFNSYTQSLCVAQAVKFGPEDATVTTEPDITKIPQIVTYSSHFVEKLSDVVKALNVSAALSVKVGTVTGSGSGGYIDEDKIKESDVNFIIQVKVTNQTIKLPNDAQFNPIEGLTGPKFADIYGDTFISGFLEGGEFVGVVSLKVQDSSKIQDIKAELEVAFSAVQAKGSGTYNASNIAKDAETSISVNWSGGGQIKDPNTKWDMETILRVAAQFPDLCARCPQRTTAILAKYTSLTSFLKVANKFQTISYDNVGVYTSDLLDDYMDYKVHWKNVRLMHDDLSVYTKSQDPDAYEPTIESLDGARHEILKNMVLIVHEVDAVRADPNVATESILKDKTIYLNPVMFAARLPVKKPPQVSTPQPDTTTTTSTSTTTTADAQTWQWVAVKSKDSKGNDILNFGNGTASPEDMMRKCYEWEAQNPGQYVKCFNTLGYIKNKISHTSQLTVAGSGVDLYVRVLIDDNWAFVPNADSPGNDFPVPGFSSGMTDDNDIDIIESLKLATARTDIAAFNSWGWVKKLAVLPTSHCGYFDGKPHQGLWIRKSLLKI